MIIDVHAHMDFLSEEKIKKVQENKKIKFVITNSVNLESCKKNLEISKKFPKIKLAVGIYPEKEISSGDFKELEEFVSKNRKEIVALGEIGLDLYETNENFELQKEIFLKELNLAKKLSLPVIIHTRKAEEEILEILENYKDLKIILHCFSGNFKLIKRGVEIGCYFSIPANIVRSEHFQKMAVVVPKEKILTETDSPLLSPFKDVENEPSFVEATIKKISEIWKTPEKEVEKQILKNSENVFGKL